MKVLGVLAAIALLVVLAVPALAAQGDENLPCTVGGHWILSGNPQPTGNETFDGLTFDKYTGNAVHYTSGPVDSTNFAAIASQDERLKLSHCIGGTEPSASPSFSSSPSPSQSATPTPSSSTSPAPSITPNPTTSPSLTPPPSSSPSYSPPSSATPPGLTPPPTDTDEAVEGLATVATGAIIVYMAVMVAALIAGAAAMTYILRRSR